MFVFFKQVNIHNGVQPKTIMKFFNSLVTWGGGVTCICRDTGMCHYFGYFFGVAPGFLGTFLGYSRIFGYHFLAIPEILGIIFFLLKFDFFKNNPDFGVLILIVPSMTLWNVACRALVSMILQFSFLFYYACAKSSILSITSISLSSYICGAFWF